MIQNDEGKFLSEGGEDANYVKLALRETLQNLDTLESTFRSVRARIEEHLTRLEGGV